LQKPLTKESFLGFQNKKIKKALFLDYDGTLREFEIVPHKAVPGSELKKIFTNLQTRDDIDVYILSGRDKGFLNKICSKYNFTLLGEHGYYLKKPGQKWKLFNDKVDLSWKSEILEIFKMYSSSTPGSHVESKTSTVVWHYRNADLEFGKWKAGELMGELTEVISNLPVEIHHGHMIVEVRSLNISKAIAMEHFIKTNNYKLVLCAGDDQTDEGMFKVESNNLISVKVGKGESTAEYQIPSPAKFRQLLKGI
ncbi:MAG: trehalose-phosphatase, partial [Fibrobacteria bacterium]|nr:trehalose-phosphatase [Fibrobacteria bacterium]